MRGRILIAAALVALTLPAAGLSGGGPGDPTFGYGKYPLEQRTFSGCGRFEAALPLYRSCLADQGYLLVSHTNDPANELPRIDAYVHSVGGWLERNCHVLMHTVGRRYGEHAHVTLTNLLDYLPKTNDPGCSAGFAHGLLIALGPQIQKLGPRGAAADCHRARDALPAVQLRPRARPCLRTAVRRLRRSGAGLVRSARRRPTRPTARRASSTTTGSPSPASTARAPARERDLAREALRRRNRPATCGRAGTGRCSSAPPARLPDSAQSLLALCRGLSTRQHAGCITGASLIRSSDPREQLRTCAELTSADAAACVRGLRVPTYALAPFRTKLSLIQACAGVRSAQRACYLWLGKALNVITNGAFVSRGCPQLRYAATRAACARGARAYEGALETFS